MSDESASIRPFLAALEKQRIAVAHPQAGRRRRSSSRRSSRPPTRARADFEKVNGSSLRVAGNLLERPRPDRRGAGHRRCRNRAADPPGDPRAGEARASGDRRVQESSTRKRRSAALPVPRFFEREERPYITAGVILARDPQTGRGNASFARFAIHDGRTAMVGIAPNHHLALFSRRAAEAGQALQIAVVIGAHPAIQLAACLYLGVGDDEIECAGSLLGAPVRHGAGEDHRSAGAGRRRDRPRGRDRRAPADRGRLRVRIPRHVRELRAGLPRDLLRADHAAGTRSTRRSNPAIIASTSISVRCRSRRACAARSRPSCPTYATSR